MADGGLKRGRELLARASGLVLGNCDAGGIKIVPSAMRPVKFCLGFLLRVRRVLNFKSSEGERVSWEHGFPSLILSAANRKTSGLFVFVAALPSRVGGPALGEGCRGVQGHSGVIRQAKWCRYWSISFCS